MADVGHLVIDARDCIVQADDGLASILSSPSAGVIGRPVLDILIDEDRETFAQCLRHLRSKRRPFRIASRVRRDGESLWTESTVGLSDIGEDGEEIVMTIVAIPDPERFDDPRELLTFALAIRAARNERNALFRCDMFVDPAWDMMLTSYIAEAEGRALDVMTLAEASRTGPSVATRWIKALVARDLLEAEDDGSHFRLSHDAHRRFERWLSHGLLKLSVEPDIR